MSIIYIMCMYSYVNFSSEGFIFSVEGLYLCILLIFLKSAYSVSNDSLSEYGKLITYHYEHLYIYSWLLKKTNIKVSILYRCFH